MSGKWIDVSHLLTGPLKHLRAWQYNLEDDTHISVFFGKEPDSRGHRVWHMSISVRDSERNYVRYATHEEVKMIRHFFLQHVPLLVEMFPAMPHETDAKVIHLWEIPDKYWD